MSYRVDVDVEDLIEFYRGTANHVKRVVKARRRAINNDIAMRVFRPYVPYRPHEAGENKPHLRDNVTATDTGVRYNQSYAADQYQGVDTQTGAVYKHYTTPGTGPFWDEESFADNHRLMLRHIIEQNLRKK